MAVPPAAILARFDADLSMIALEAIGTQQNLFEPKPGLSRTSLFAHKEPARGKPGRFPHASDSPATGARLRKSSRPPESGRVRVPPLHPTFGRKLLRRAVPGLQ
jgi:hypothetical protein